MMKTGLLKLLTGKMVFLLSVLLYILLFTVTLSWYRFYFDTDGVAYMTIARRIAQYDFLRSFNNLWSPLNNWLVAPFSVFTNDYVLIFKVINAFLSIGIMGMTYLIAKKYLNSQAIVNLTVLILPLVLLSYSHVQLAGDLLQFFLFLIYFYLITIEGFFLSVRYNVLAALVMFLAFLAKSFSLPFFLIQYPGLYILFLITHQKRRSVSRFIKPVASGLITVAGLSLLWAYCLYLKYDQWMLSAGGTLNYHWMVGREMAVMPGNNLLIPPPYHDSPGFWEDPYIYYETFIGPLSSMESFVRTGKLILTNIKTALACLMEISFLSYTIFFFLLLFLYQKKIRTQIFHVAVLVWTSLIIMGGYMLIHVETRYYWPVAVMLLIGGGYLLENHLFPVIRSNALKSVVAFLFVFSFVFSPVYTLKDLKGSGRDIYSASAFLKENRVTGKFAGNYTGAGLNSWYLKLAYLSGSNLYTLRKVNFTQEELLDAVRSSRLDFFIYTYATEMEKQLFMKGAMAAAAARILPMPGSNKLVLTFLEANQTR